MEVATSPNEPTSTMATQSPPTTSAATMLRPKPSRAPHSNPNLSTLPPLITTSSSALGGTRPPVVHKKSSYARLKHLSSYSNTSGSVSFSRPESYVFPAFHSSLPYALVRDFAYAPTHPLHYGPPPMDDPSTASTPGSEFNRRLSDPPRSMWPPTRAQWAATDPNGGNLSFDTGEWEPRLPATAYGGGPPYKEDDDLLSPVVTSSRHKKSRSNIVDYDFARSMPGTGKRASQSYAEGRGYYQQGGHQTRYASDQQHLKSWQQRQAEEEVAVPPPLDTDLSKPFDRFDDEEERWGRPDAYGYSLDERDESRYSRDYQFTIASPDEEMHGKAVALFDFARENDNELPLFEGQVIWVSYRHGQGWLVAQDPRSGESGLVPEEYVRLVRDIEGGIRGLNGLAAPGDEITDDIDTPTLDTLEPYKMSYGSQGMSQPHERSESSSGSRSTNTSSAAPGQSGYYAPVQSHFSTSSKDLEPYPQHQLLGSQASTPIAPNESQLPNNAMRLPATVATATADNRGASNEAETTRSLKNPKRQMEGSSDFGEAGLGVNLPPKGTSAMSSVFGGGGGGKKNSSSSSSGSGSGSSANPGGAAGGRGGMGKSSSEKGSNVSPERSRSNASTRSTSSKSGPRRKK